MQDTIRRHYETFSYLPPFTEEQIRDQIRYMVARGWICAIEFAPPERAGDPYWRMWKLPLFGVTDEETVLRELDACRAAHPACLVRLIGYDSRRQTRGLAFVTHRPADPPAEA